MEVIKQVPDQLKPRLETLLSTKGYYTFIGQKLATAIGFTKSELIFDCNYVYWSGNIETKVSCEKIGEIRLLNQPSYFNCYTVKMSKHSPIRKNIIGLDLVIHIPNYDSVPYPYTAYVSPALGKGGRIQV